MSPLDAPHPTSPMRSAHTPSTHLTLTKPAASGLLGSYVNNGPNSTAPTDPIFSSIQWVLMPTDMWNSSTQSGDVSGLD
jgi:hypothetical protein